MIHHLPLCARPEVGTHVDRDHEHGHRTRIDFLRELADRSVLVPGFANVAPSIAMGLATRVDVSLRLPMGLGAKQRLPETTSEERAVTGRQ